MNLMRTMPPKEAIKISGISLYLFKEIFFMEKNMPVDCTFMLSPMSDNYIDIILGGLAKLDSSKVNAKTQRLGTRYSGPYESVTDAVFACFIYAFCPDVHMTLDAIITPSEKEGYSEGGRPNEKEISEIDFDAESRFLICADEKTAVFQKAKELAQKEGIYEGETLGFPYLKGSILKIRGFYLELLKYFETQNADYTLHITLSVNSPTGE